MPTVVWMGQDPPPGPLVGPAEILQMLGVGRSRLRQITADRRFPAPFQTLIAGSVWLRSDVEEYIRKYRPQQLKDRDDEDEQA
ncbi:hypothetical protein GCM10022225_62570 [Plantactinospora mayteni]|uniref:DNA-binding protein n=3 Tax=Plantactinospora TaxID=673534 RepID=A0ABQ4EZB2_9ACTN|nr:hypothetical protein Pma05_65730 [Plantactinospora mayteni]